MTTIALMANTLHYPQGGGHRWTYLNWALGFRSIGCDVVWVEWVDARSWHDVSANMAALRAHLSAYGLPEGIVRRFRRSALIDIDPGLLQIWMTNGNLHVARYDLDFTIGETVGTRSARFPDAGRRWLYTPPCVDLEWWPACPSPPE